MYFLTGIFLCKLYFNEGLQGGTVVKNPPANAGDVGWEDPLEKEMATHSNILAWEILWIDEPGRLQPMVLQKVRHD